MHGIICMWSGILEDIPDGWVICDGQNATPDLRDRFIFAAGQYVHPGQSGGSSQHKHTVTVGAHEHSHSASSSSEPSDIPSGDTILGNPPEGQYQDETDPHSHVITVEAEMHDHDTEVSNAGHYPVWYCLAFIMKL